LPEKSPLVTAIYPGSFDPITNGHLDLIQRGSKMFGRLIVSILRNDSKQPLFTVEERMEMLREVLHVYPNVEIESFDGLLVDYAGARRATVLLRGIRAISDYEYELQMALMNRRLRPEIETVFMMANEAYSFISSRLVKDVFPRREYRRTGSALRGGAFEQPAVQTEFSIEGALLKSKCRQQ
jgi:pantetheine-phosphate adenylyltransferase